MRVCQICNGFPPALGGTETHNYSLVKYLVERGHSVEVVVVQQPPELLRRKNYPPQTVQTLCYPSYTLPELPQVVVHNIFPRPVAFYYDLLRKVHELERGGRFDVLDLHSYLLALPFSQKRKMLLSLHFYELSCPKTDPPLPCQKATLARCRQCINPLRYLYWKATRRWSLLKVSKLMVKYEYLKQQLVKSGIEARRITVIPHWIDVNGIQAASTNGISRTGLGLSPSATAFTFLGRLTQVNGLLLLLEAFRRLVKAHPNTNLVLIGDGELRAELEKLCRRDGIGEKVKFLGMVPHAQVPEYLALGDIHIQPQAAYNNYNWSLLEMMATERPIIATNMVGTREVLEDGYSALLAEPTPESLVARMKELVENPGLGQRIARNALNTVREKHSLNNLPKYEELLAALAGATAETRKDSGKAAAETR